MATIEIQDKNGSRLYKFTGTEVQDKNGSHILRWNGNEV